MLRNISVALFAFIIYVLFNGSITLYDIVTGIVVALTVSLLFSKIVVTSEGKSLDPRRLLWLLAYLAHYLTIIELRAHLDVAKRIVDPKMPIRPGIVRVPYTTSTDYGTVLVANSITNTPGTVVVDLDEDKKIMYVHWINVKALTPQETYTHISKTFDKYARKIFD